MKTTDKIKIEVYVPPKIKQAIDEIADDKGITIADAMRRAIELWLEREHDN